MQADSSALNKCSGKNQSSINFRPSPNFKHMKKYLKSKFEEDMNSGTVPQERRETYQQNKVKTDLQPPLPPNSPPPDSPLSFTVKQEVEDDDYESAERSDDNAQDEFPAAAAAPAGHGTAPAAHGPAAPAERRVMCKDFVRGTCARGAACIYMHELDVTQLEGVYRFCRDFENKRCMRPVCYFVHATTFEKEHFMRTGTLPPHATAHLRNPAAPAAAAPAPAPPPHAADVAADLAPLFASAPAAAVASGVSSCNGALEARLPLDALPAAALPAGATAAAAAAPPAPPLKREWRDHDTFSSPPRDLDSIEPLAKKCKRCDLTELRLQHAKAQVASMLRASQELDDQLEQVVKTNKRLHAVLNLLFKPRRVLESNVNNNNFLGGNGALAAVLDGDGNKALLSQMKVLLAKILLGSDGLPSENGRDLAT